MLTFIIVMGVIGYGLSRLAKVAKENPGTSIKAAQWGWRLLSK
jgi:hypothetical protein